MIYLVGTGVNKMKSNFIYAYPMSKMSKKQFREHAEVASVINIASSNIYRVETDLVQDEQIFSSLNSALTFADQEFDEIRLNENIKGYIDGDFNDADIRDVFFGSQESEVKKEEKIAEVVKPVMESVQELKERVAEYQENLNKMNSEIQELESISYKETQKLRALIPSFDYKSPSVKWEEEDFEKITKLNQVLDTI